MTHIEKRIKIHLAKKGPCSIREISEYLGMSPYKVYRIMETMKDKGKLVKKEIVSNNNDKPSQQ